MYRKRKTNKKYFYFSFIIITMIIFIYFFGHQSQYSKIEAFFKDIGTSIETFFIPTVELDNSQLIQQINQQLVEENNELKKLLELDMESYQLIHACIIKRDINWYQEVTINKGKKHGIKKNMAVVANGSLIGKIKKVTNYSSTVQLLTSNSSNMKVAVDIKNNENSYHGILNGYSTQSHLLEVKNISKYSNIEIGDAVYTNGLGGIYPSGIYIGTVAEIVDDSLELSKDLKIKFISSYDTLRYVTIVGKELSV